MIVNSKLIGADKVIGSMAECQERAANLSAPLTRLAQYHQRKAQRILRSGERGVKARHAGGLAASITYAQPSRNEIEVGSNKVHAALQQFGGTVESSRSGGWLVIPTDENRGGRKDPRYTSPRELSKADGWKFFRNKEGKLLFGRKKYKERYIKGLSKKARRLKGQMAGGLAAKLARMAEETMEIMFVLVKSVTIPPHMYATHEPDDQRIWERVASDWILRGKV